ncbi:hypothetical protein GCM10027440_01790 [Nocardiopsis coralliicola]
MPRGLSEAVQGPERGHAGDLQHDHDRILGAVVRGDAAEASRLTTGDILRAAAIRDREPGLRAAGHQDREAFPPHEG